MSAAHYLSKRHLVWYISAVSFGHVVFLDSGDVFGVISNCCRDDSEFRGIRWSTRVGCGGAGRADKLVTRLPSESFRNDVQRGAPNIHPRG